MILRSWEGSRAREGEDPSYVLYDFWAVAHSSASFSFHVCSFTLLAFIFFFIMTDTLRSEGGAPHYCGTYSLGANMPEMILSLRSLAKDLACLCIYSSSKAGR